MRDPQSCTFESMSEPELKMFQTPVAAGESTKEFLGLLSMVAESYEPCTAYELFLVSRMAALHWRILRLQNHESNSISLSRARHTAEDGSRYEMMLPGNSVSDAAQYTALEHKIGKLIGELREEFHISQTRRQQNAALALRAPEVIETQVTSLLGAKELMQLEEFDLVDDGESTK